MKPNGEKETLGSAVTRVLSIKSSKFVYMFVKSAEENDMIEFLKTAPVEIRLTVGTAWDNQFF